MKKIIIGLLCIVAVLGMKYLDKPISEEVEYFTKINHIIKDYNFCTARVNNGTIMLYDANDSIVKEVEFASYNQEIPLVYIRKKNDNIYFISGGSVDDEYGILFINNGSDYILDGIMSLERVGGNSFHYNTR